MVCVHVSLALVLKEPTVYSVLFILMSPVWHSVWHLEEAQTVNKWLVSYYHCFSSFSLLAKLGTRHRIPISP